MFDASGPWLSEYLKLETVSGVASQGALERDFMDPALQPYPDVQWSIGLTDSSNPFYLFSKLNAGLLLWAPFAQTMREEYFVLIARSGGFVGVYAKNCNSPN